MPGCIRNVFAAVVALTVQGTLCFAQTSDITGRVADTTGAVVPSVAVSVTHVDTGVVRKTITNAEGYYTVSLLPQGNYRVGVQAAGFQSQARSGIVLDEGGSMRLDFMLEVGQLAETVEVKGSAQLLETERATLSTVVTNEKVKELPLLGRNPVDLVQLVPGVRTVGNFGGLWVASANTSSMSISGGPPGGNNLMIDGVAAEHFTSGGFQVYMSVDATEEFRVITRNATAEFGRTGGGVINWISKSGTNEYHGGVYEFFRNKSLNAKGFFDNLAGATKAPFNFNQYGATVGGPIQKNKTFFFFNWERVEQRNSATAFRTVPTALERQGDFSQTKDSAGRQIVIYDPSTTRINPSNTAQRIRDVFPGNFIPQNRMHPVARAVLPYYPAPNTQGSPFTDANNFFAQASAPLEKNVYGIKIDRYVTPVRRLSGRYTYDNTPNGSPNYFGNIADNNVSGQTFKRQSLVLSYTDALQPDLLLELRAGANRLAQVRIARSIGFDVSKLGLPAALNTQTQLMLFPQFGITDESTIGGNQTDHQIQNQGSYSTSGSLTKIKSKHTIKFGGELRMYYVNNTQGGPNMQFNFSRSFTQGPNPNTASSTAGYGLATFLLGDPTGGTAMRYAPVTYFSKYLGTFVQDDWKLTPKLTVNFGLRWEFQGAITDRFNAISNFNPGLVTTTSGVSLVGGLEYPGSNGLSHGARENWYRDLGPRFGFAYQILPMTVIRGGYGIFYVPDTGNASKLGATGFSLSTALVSSIDGGFTPYDTLTNPFPQGIQQPYGSSQGALTGLGTAVSGNLRTLRRPYDQQWNLSVQRQLPGNWLIEVGYAGNRGVHLAASRAFDYLPENFLSMGSALQQQVPNPYAKLITTGSLSQPTVTRGTLLDTLPQFTGADGEDDWASSIYHALTVRAERRFSKGFSLLVSYTFSKVIDDNVGNGLRGQINNGGSNDVQNWSNTRTERAISTDNQPHRFVFTPIWILPFGKNGSALYRKLAGGWQLNSILTLQSGDPIAITQGAAPFGGTRPMVVGDPNAIDPSISKWFNTAAFALTPAFTYGNAPRNLPRTQTDGLFNLDCSALKNFTVKERFRFQLRGEFFSFTNTPTFGAPGTTVNNANFGVVRASSGSRNIQLGAKLNF